MKMEQKGVHRSLVQKLRTPIFIEDDVEDVLAEKLNEIAEALAYIIEKKHDKRKIKLGKKSKK